MRKSWLFVLMLLLDGCASHGIRPLREFEIATSPYRNEAKESFVGSMMYERGCLLFASEDGARRLPIWPDGSTFEESLVTFHRPGKADQRLILGEEIRLDGQSSRWAAAPGYEPFEHQCVAQPFFVAGVAPAN
jgi:hypothetical protein